MQGFTQESYFTLTLDEDINKPTWLTFGRPFKINNVTIQDDSTYVIPTHFPELDTIYRSNGSNFQEYILTRFRPSREYVFVYSCCGTADLALKEDKHYQAVQNKEEFEVCDSLRMVTAFSPGVRFEIEPTEKRSNLVAVFDEEAGFPYAIVFDNVDKESIFYPIKGYYFSNITTLRIGHLLEAEHIELEKTEERVDAVFYAHLDPINKITYRFFHDEKLILSYDVSTNKIELKIDEPR